MKLLSSASGTTLVEAIVAIGILAGAVTSLAGLSHMAIRSAMLARERSMAAIYSLQKMEALCRDARSLAASPGDSLADDTPGFIEYLDPRGTVTAGASGAFVRRWSVTPMPSDASLLAIQVEVAPCRRLSPAARCGDAAARVRLASVRSRLAW
jgi:hypothetical protein